MELDHYDLLGRPPIEDAQDVINWVLEGLCFPKVLTVELEVGPLQSPTSGSCGVATESFLATKAGINRPRWSQGQSATRHGEWIQNFITYHMTALKQPLRNPRDWFVMDTAYPVLFHNPQQALEPEFGLEYHDYKLYNVTQAHPVHSFGTLHPKQLPTLQCGTSQSDSPSALLPVVELKCTPLKRHFVSVYDLQATTATSLDLSSTNKWNSLQDDIDMSPLQAPLAEAEASWSDMIKISDSQPSPSKIPTGLTFVDLTTPPHQNHVVAAADSYNHGETIDISSSGSSDLPTTLYQFSDTVNQSPPLIHTLFLITTTRTRL
ncbi:hypothetical protein K439DRAFT_1620404 [Ramaria rubella]|nr:hypothetical protein K439DRAFT_1620404 [Ramaria rubella]